MRPAAHGGAAAGWLDLSANLNPCGVPAAVAAAIAEASYTRYADLDPGAAEARLACEAGLAPNEVLLTAGATEAIALVCDALLTGDATALVAEPAYGELARAAMRTGARVIAHRALTHSAAALVDAARKAGAAVVLLCDPNNPTGARLSSGSLEALATSGARLVVDQSFLPFAEPLHSCADLVARGAVLIRSLTKALAIPGVRTGYICAAPELLTRIRARRDPWTVGAHAIAAAGAGGFGLSNEIRARIAGWREELSGGLEQRALPSLPSVTNYLLLDAGGRADALVAGLADRRIAVRSCASFGLADHIRVAVRPPDEQRVLLEALDEIGAAA